uniref:TBC1 domain family member 30 n=1 Tax=Cacopsylla melanoneura TaxID=428564 RepID=A0A8D8Q2N4_9HEMI
MSSLLNSLKGLPGAASIFGEDTRMKFSVCPSPGESGYEQWLSAMKMVARLAGGIPQEFRKTLWLTLAEKHLISRGVDWAQAEKLCFNEWSNPDDEELGVQIVKDLHRTGCSLFCGASGQQNQAVLKRVLLGYARWNKVVGYCQGFNMLAALILQVMDRNEVDSVKVMIYLIEGVLPESYFANSLRGLSVDMAVFRDLLRVKLPALSKHLEQLQNDSKDSGTSYEPPLTNVFTMQWFLTLFSNCLPQTTVLRVWDLIFLEGNAILLQTALAIWNSLSDRIMMVESADEFYSIMGVLTREMLEFGTIDANNLIKDITTINLPELTEMRERYLYNITPWTQVARKGLRLFYAEDEVEDTDEEDDKVANIATAYGFFKSRKSDSSLSRPMSPSRVSSYPSLSEDREKIALDISALKKQYCKLRERQRQAHVIFNAAYEGVVNLSQTASTPAPNSAPTVNHLLQGKNAILSMKGKRPGPPPGSIPPSLRPRRQERTKDSGETIHWKDEPKLKSRKSLVASCSSDTILSEVSNTTQDSLSGTSSRKDSISSSSSSSTELCDDESDRLSDFDSDVGHNEKQVPVPRSPKKKTPDEKIPDVIDVLSPESVDNALCCDNTQASASSSVSVSPIELDDTTVPCDKSVLSVRELELSNLETIVNKTETNELTLNVDNDSIGTPSEIHGSRSPQMETVSHNTEALIDLGKKLDQLKSTNSNTSTTQDNQTEEGNDLQGSGESNDCSLKTEADTASIDNRPDKDPNIMASEEVDIKTNDTYIVKNNTSALHNNVDSTEVATKGRSSERKSSSDLALLKILNENSEILNRIQSRRNSLSMLEEVNSELKQWKTFDKQKSLDICPTRYEKQSTKWFSSSVDFSSMKLGSISSRSSFETIDETKELKNLDSEEDAASSDVISDVYNQYSDRNKDTPHIEKTKFGIPKITEESDQTENVPENTKPLDVLVQKKTSKIPFNPFPSKITTRQNKELGIKLGLYSSNECNKNKS